VLFHKYVQWQLDIQVAEAQQSARDAGLTIGLFHDLALATDRCGQELWAHRRFFVPDCRVGAPPDDFSPKGQDWSFPPPASETHWEDGYRLFRESIRHACRHGGALRIDHVMQYFRLFWIPSGLEAAEGTYVRNRHENLVRILTLESHRNQVLIVGEDLGTVEPEVREILARHGILGYRLFWFEKSEHGEPRPPSDYPAQALVSSTTHDLPTLAGFWLGRDIEARFAAGVLPDQESYRHAMASRSEEKQKLLDALFREGLLPDWVPRSAKDLPELTGELHNAVTGFLTSTPCLLLALNQEDLTKETEQQNLPGTTHQYPNWRRKMRYSLEELETSPEVRGFIKMYRHWLDQTGRAERVG
jgi:4-alpha-glucanotransferase